MPPRTRKADFPCMKCGEHCKKGTKAIQCALCEIWIHQTCSKLDDSIYKYLVQEFDCNGRISWHCDSCDVASRKLNAQLVVITKRLDDLEESHKKGNADVATLSKKVEMIEGNIEKSKEREVRIKSDTISAVFDEQRERKSREMNLVIHNIPEPDPELKNADERKDADKVEMFELFEKIEANVSHSDVRFFARVGEESDATRPLIVGMKSAEAKKKILDNARKLADMEKALSDISIVHDLTKAQRAEEKALYEEATRRNNAMSATQQENYLHKVVGRRGEKRLIRVKKTSGKVATSSVANSQQTSQ